MAKPYTIWWWTRKRTMTSIDVVDGARSRHRSAIGWSSWTNHMRGAVQMQVTTIGLDIAKNVFQGDEARLTRFLA